MEPEPTSPSTAGFTGDGGPQNSRAPGDRNTDQNTVPKPLAATADTSPSCTPTHTGVRLTSIAFSRMKAPRELPNQKPSRPAWVYAADQKTRRPISNGNQYGTGESQHQLKSGNLYKPHQILSAYVYTTASLRAFSRQI